MDKITVIGSVALDTIRTPRQRFKDVLGGSATYFSISASFFTKVNLIATVGKDFPVKYRNIIESFGINTLGLETKEGRTFRWEGSYVDDLNCAKTINTELNVFAQFRPVVPKEYKNSKIVFLANIDPDLQNHILRCFDGRCIVGCDSMNYWIKNKPASLKRLIKKVTFMFLNDSEARLFSGEDNVIKAGKFLLSLGSRFAIIKRGEYGAVLFSDNSIIFLTPAFLLEDVCDPTGAGDAFAGGFLGYLAKKRKIDIQSVRKALLYGSVMASFAIEDFSIRRFLSLKKEDILDRYYNFIRLTMA